MRLVVYLVVAAFSAIPHSEQVFTQERIAQVCAQLDKALQKVRLRLILLKPELVNHIREHAAWLTQAKSSLHHEVSCSPLADALNQYFVIEDSFRHLRARFESQKKDAAAKKGCEYGDFVPIEAEISRLLAQVTDLKSKDKKRMIRDDLGYIQEKLTDYGKFVRDCMIKRKDGSLFDEF